MTVTIESVFVCDDVRREDNGKLIIIGVYGRDIGLSQFPAAIAPCLVLRLNIKKPIDGDIEFRSLLDDNPKTTIKGHIKLENPGMSILNTPPLLVDNIDSDAILSFQWRLPDSEEWEDVYSIPIVHR